MDSVRRWIKIDHAFRIGANVYHVDVEYIPGVLKEVEKNGLKVIQYIPPNNTGVCVLVLDWR